MRYLKSELYIRHFFVVEILKVLGILEFGATTAPLILAPMVSLWGPLGPQNCFPLKT